MSKEFIKKHVGKREDLFVVLDKERLQDERLSWKATGLYAYFCSLPGDWKLNLSDLEKRKKDGRDSVRAGMKELQEYGYLHKLAVRNEKGHIMHWETLFFEFPEDNEHYNPLEKKEPKKAPKQEPKAPESTDKIIKLVAKLGKMGYAPLDHTTEMLKTNEKLLENLNTLTFNGKTQSKAKIITAFINEQRRIPAKEEFSMLVSLNEEGHKPKNLEIALKKIGKVENVVVLKGEIENISNNEQDKTTKRYETKQTTQPKGQNSPYKKEMKSLFD